MDQRDLPCVCGHRLSEHSAASRYITSEEKVFCHGCWEIKFGVSNEYSFTHKFKIDNLRYIEDCVDEKS